MGNKALDRLESQLEALIEGAFARIFQKHLSARDLSILIGRAIEDAAATSQDVDGKLVAPDSYSILLHPKTREQFLSEYPDLARRLARLVVELTQESGYHLNCEPTVFIEADNDLALHQFRISARHGEFERFETTNMYPVDKAGPAAYERGLIRIIGAAAPIELKKPVTNIGRDDNNDIVVDDAYVSRHHLQLRWRHGVHILFDLDSRGGTYVDNVSVREHQLGDGDIIRIGRSELVYNRRGTRPDKDGTSREIRQDREH
ncbi:MAG: DUF3662 domain-containing protein [Chloroflexi bacterium]|nr:DUF3662 domain-containing protein [Chloroflexota bacterium]